MGRGEDVDSGGRLGNRTGLEKGIYPRGVILSTPGPDRAGLDRTSRKD